MCNCVGPCLGVCGCRALAAVGLRPLIERKVSVLQTFLIFHSIFITLIFPLGFMDYSPFMDNH